MERRCLTCTAPGRNNLHTSGIALALSDSPDSRGPVRSVTSFSMMEGASAYSPKFIGRVSRTKQHASIPVRTQIVKSFSSASGLEKYKPRVGTEDTTKGFGQGSQNAHVPRAVQKLRIHARRKVDAAPGSPARRATTARASSCRRLRWSRSSPCSTSGRCAGRRCTAGCSRVRCRLTCGSSMVA